MRYAREFDEVKTLGNAAAHPNATTDKARFWSVNFAAQWNETMRQLANKKQLSIGDSARMFALANLAAADAAIAASFSQAAQEVVDARILLGIHFRSADEEARQLGNRVAHWVSLKFLGPRRPRK